MLEGVQQSVCWNQFFFFALNALSVSQRGPAYKHLEKGMIIESVGVRGLA